MEYIEGLHPHGWKPDTIASYRPERFNYIRQYIPENAVICEIGVMQGQLTVQMLRALKPKQIHCIDPWLRYGEHADRQHNGPGIAGVVIPALGTIPQVKVHVKRSQDAIDEFPDEFFDFIYIDGLHTYEQVKLDLDLYWPKLKCGGVVAGDDYGWANSPTCTVKRAVQEFHAEHKDECTLDLKGHQQFAFIKKQSALVQSLN